MARIKYVGPASDQFIPDAYLVVQRGEVVEVDDDLAAGLVEGDWEIVAAPKPTKTKDEESAS